MTALSEELWHLTIPKAYHLRMGMPVSTADLPRLVAKHDGRLLN